MRGVAEHKKWWEYVSKMLRGDGAETQRISSFFYFFLILGDTRMAGQTKLELESKADSGGCRILATPWKELRSLYLPLSSLLSCANWTGLNLMLVLAGVQRT